MTVRRLSQQTSNAVKMAELSDPLLSSGGDVSDASSEILEVALPSHHLGAKIIGTSQI